MSPWSSLALGDLLGTESGAPCPHQKGGCPRLSQCPSGWPRSTSWFKCHLQSHPLTLTQKLFSGVTLPDAPWGRVFAQAQADPGLRTSWPCGWQQEARPCVLLGPLLVKPQRWLRGGRGQARVDSHLVAGQRVLRGLQVRAGLTHEDVALAGDGPDGLQGGAAEDPPALTAGQVEQGQLAWADGSHHWEGDGQQAKAGLP